MRARFTTSTLLQSGLRNATRTALEARAAMGRKLGNEKSVYETKVGTETLEHKHKLDK